MGSSVTNNRGDEKLGRQRTFVKTKEYEIN